MFYVDEFVIYCDRSYRDHHRGLVIYFMGGGGGGGGCQNYRGLIERMCEFDY